MCKTVQDASFSSVKPKPGYGIGNQFVEITKKVKNDFDR